MKREGARNGNGQPPRHTVFIDDDSDPGGHMIDIVGISTVLDDGQIAWVPIRPGLNVLYGKNGAGKTRLLNGCSAALAIWGPAPDPWRLVYRTGYVQVHEPITAAVLASDLDSFAFHVACHLIGMDPRQDLEPWELSESGPPEPGEVYALLVEHTAKRLGLSGLTTEAAERLLGDGHLLIAPMSDGVDPSSAIYLATRPGDGVIDPVLITPAALVTDYGPRGHRQLQGELDAGDHRRGMPPSPESFGFDLPDWAALPVVHLGTVRLVLVSSWSSGLSHEGRSIARPSALSADELATRTWAVAVRRAQRKYRTIGGVQMTAPDDKILAKRSVTLLAGAELHIDGAVVEELQQISRQANLRLKRLVEEPPRLVVKPGTLLGTPVEWCAQWAGNDPFGIESLGDAHRRMAKLAISRALVDGGHQSISPQPMTIVTIDEPERATHPAAAKRIAQALPELGDYVLAASHSSDVIDAATTLLHVHRDNTHVKVDNLALGLGPGQRAGLSDKLGMSLAQLVTLIRVIVLVEGPNDDDVISEFCRDEIDTARAVVIPMGGTRGLSALPETRWLVHATDAALIVVLDNIADVKELDALVNKLKMTSDPDQQHRIRFAGFKTGRQSAERNALDAMLDAAIKARCVDRFHPFGFAKRDIAEYLPVTEILRGAESWAALKRQFGPFGTNGGAKFKSWINQQGGHYTPVGVRKAAKRVVKRWDCGAGRNAERPDEFNKLGGLIRRLAIR